MALVLMITVLLGKYIGNPIKTMSVSADTMSVFFP